MKKILIVDDDELTLSLYDLLLEEIEDVSWHTSDSGTSALSYLDQCSAEQWPDYIFIDLHMPDMSGYGFTEKFQERFGTNRKKPGIYVLSSSISHKDKEMIKNYPVIKGFLSKPLTEEVLLDLIGGRANNFINR